MAKKKEATVEQRLRALYDLQLIDSRIDDIRNVRGELPLEVSDLEDEVAGLKTRLEKEQQKNVRNNREFNSLTKEVEYQELEIELAEKHIREFKAQIEQKKEVIATTKEHNKERETHLKHKKSELNAILKETEEEEKTLLDKSEDYKKKIEERLVKAYNRIRGNVKNGLAIVPIERGASGGSYFTIPPQVQMEIAARKKIITDEHSGRILVDAELAEEQKTKMKKYFAKL